jgi:ArsR family transcriptional regulator, arsenate/arsenite/antimonite-responsive transcriptional repressor
MSHSSLPIQSYNIFIMLNMNNHQKISAVFEAFGSPARLQIALAIGRGEACVCHLAGQLHMRQAYLSQHLMVLREKGLLTTRRDGKYLYYSLLTPELLDMIAMAARMSGISLESLDIPDQISCSCPQCAPVEAELQRNEA